MWVPLTGLHSFCVLTCLCFWALQYVSAPCWLTLILYPDSSLCLCSPECECPLLTHILSVSWLVFMSGLSRMCVLIAILHSFHVLIYLCLGPPVCGCLASMHFFCVLTCLYICTLQYVSAPCWLTPLPCPDLSLCLGSPECVCSSLAYILSMS